MLGCCVFISFSELVCLQYFVGRHLDAIALVAPQTITLVPSAWERVAVAASITVVPPVIKTILLLSLPMPSRVRRDCPNEPGVARSCSVQPLPDRRREAQPAQ